MCTRTSGIASPVSASLTLKQVGGSNITTLKAIRQKLEGTILVGSDSRLTLELTDGSTFVGNISGDIAQASPLYSTSNWRPVQSQDGFRYQDVRLFHRALGAAEVALYFDAFSSAYDASLGWVEENADTTELTGRWSGGIDYEADGRALLLGENTFTPYTTSTGNVVTVDVKATFFESDGEDPVEAGTQAAIRLGTNGCFQVWTRKKLGVASGGVGELGWVDVSADGVAPANGEEWNFRFTFDYGANLFSVAVIADGRRYALQAADGARTFPLAAAGDAISNVAFKGETSFTSLLGKCMDKLRGLVLMVF